MATAMAPDAPMSGTAEVGLSAVKPSVAMIPPIR
jgi:hypothetical protein